ncbi:MAG: hypothetical protein A2Y81_11770 [Nitrospirae bacterium RBG_13_43_8]|nr:MAG: hypothetical protein A2Y81_11770 [Nitrospirae bacterium RBG_13_43_8]
MEPIIWSAMKQVIWIIAIIAILSILAILLPFILKRKFSPKKTCVCGQNLKPKDTFCPKCGKRIER